MALFNEHVLRTFTSGLLDGVTIPVTIVRLSAPAPVGTVRTGKSLSGPGGSAYREEVVRVDEYRRAS